MNFEYVLLILITLAFLGVRYLVVTLYTKESVTPYSALASKSLKLVLLGEIFCKNFKYVLLILITLAFLGVRYLVVTL